MPCYSCVASTDTEKAVEILTRYQSTLLSPEEQELKASIGKISHIFQSELFQALIHTCGTRWPARAQPTNALEQCAV
uniref:L27-1 domain-containing protein n=1 Tax=Anas zonorhyncha TaxID=75864 RepID=A0A8B9ZVN3_9AVES